MIGGVLHVAAAASVPGADITVSAGTWVAFLAFVVALIVGDLVLFHREEHEITLREAAVASSAWISIGVAFGGLVWWWLGSAAGVQYYTAYVIEKSLSVDNVFVWAVLLGYFAVPKVWQHRVLFWGVFGALVLRAMFIFAGIALLERLEWLTFVFGAFLIFTGARVGTHDEDEVHPERNPVLRLMRRYLPMTPDYRGSQFVVREQARRLMTPLLAVLVLIEVTDVIFAVDSIPAVLAVSRSTFIVFSSNAFAILGLRSLYFLLAGFQDRLVHLHIGLGIILAFVGLTMVVAPWFDVPTLWSLAVIVVVLGVTVAVSLRTDPTEAKGG